MNPVEIGNAAAFCSARSSMPERPLPIGSQLSFRDISRPADTIPLAGIFRIGGHPRDARAQTLDGHGHSRFAARVLPTHYRGHALTLNIEGVGIGGENPCRFVFEVSNAHGGQFERALKLVTAAKDCGADFVKFQAYTPAELVALRGDGPAPEPWGSQGWTMERLYEKARTPLEWLPDLFRYARDIGIVPFSSVFGLESLAVLEKCSCPAYKIARLDNRDMALFGAASSRGKPVLVSTDEPQAAPRDAYTCEWLWCPAGYPTPADKVRLPSFQWPAAYIGLSSHCLDPLLPVAAVARGAKLIEMHGMLAEEPSELESNVSLDQYEFAKMIADVRRVEGMLA